VTTPKARERADLAILAAHRRTGGDAREGVWFAVANVHVDYGQLESAAGQLSAAQQELESQLARLKSIVDQLVGAGFATDQASGRFHASYEQWNNGAKNVVAGLYGMSSFLKTAVQQHQQLDASLGQQAGG
jgi:WXG100 family type VII secretion target